MQEKYFLKVCLGKNYDDEKHESYSTLIAIVVTHSTFLVKDVFKYLKQKQPFGKKNYFNFHLFG